MGFQLHPLSPISPQQFNNQTNPLYSTKQKQNHPQWVATAEPTVPAPANRPAPVTTTAPARAAESNFFSHLDILMMSEGWWIMVMYYYNMYTMCCEVFGREEI